MLLAIDAEFVMFSPEEKVSRHGVEAVTRGARLGLARISVLRGDPGPSSGARPQQVPRPGLLLMASLVPCLRTAKTFELRKYVSSYFLFNTLSGTLPF